MLQELLEGKNVREVLVSETYSKNDFLIKSDKELDSLLKKIKRFLGDKVEVINRRIGKAGSSFDRLFKFDNVIYQISYNKNDDDELVFTDGIDKKGEGNNFFGDEAAEMIAALVNRGRKPY